MKRPVLITIIVVVVALVVISSLNKKDKQVSKRENTTDVDINKTSNNTEILGDENSNKYETQTKDQASVTIDITPKQLGIKEDENIFTIALNTHSVELDSNFSEIMVLKDDLGNLYSAIEWTGNKGGHHISGDIIFPQIDKQAKSITLQINGINQVDRIFKWILK